jgi:hypothetical protein
MTWPSRPARRNSQRTTSSRRSWQQILSNFGEIAIWIILFDRWETSCYAIDSFAAFAWIHWMQIVPFELGAASIEPWFFQKWKKYTKKILPFLHAAERDSWHYRVTGDELWFFFDISPRRMWTLSREDVATKPRQQIQSKKFMFTIIWNPTRFYVVDILSNDTKMNSDYFVTNILISLEQMIFPCRRTSHEKRLVVSVDNCFVHTSRGSTNWLEKYGIHRMPD